MAKIFRQIRRVLLTENRFSKYLIYAGGEIVLVVIGILIALQINNWNESRKAQVAQKDLLVNLYENIWADSLSLLDNKQNILRIIKAQKQIHAFRKGLINSEDIEEPHKMRGSVRNYSITRANHPDIAKELTDEELKENIRAYYRLLASLDNAYTQYDNVVKQVVRPYLSEHLVMNPDYLFNHQDDLDNPDQSGSFLVLDRFYRTVKSDDFGQILFEANLKAIEALEFYDWLLEANSELRRSIEIRLDK